MYNENGLRVQKTVNGIATDYTLHGKNVVHMKMGNDELHFFYDAQNKPAVVVYNGVPYSYVKNLQGDIVGILDSNKNVVVSYVYDAWGRPISCLGTMASMLGKINPFRYRGYVYDEETGLYYLRSRYYNVIWMRFINADILITRNVYQYCNNNPCKHADHSGLEADAAWLFTDINIDADAAIPADPEQIFNDLYLPLIMSFLTDPAAYDYPYQGGSGKPIDCSHLMQEITGYGSPMAKDRYNDFSGSKGPLFENGELAVELVVGMEVFKSSIRTNPDGTKERVENGHVGMLIKYDFGDGNGEVWAVFQSVSVPVSRTPARYPEGTDLFNGPNITRFYNYDGSCNWENYIDPWYY